jgi:hypothetical protein
VASTGLFVVPNFVVQTAVSTAGAADTTTPTSNSGLLVFLPLIGTVIGAIIALIAAFLGARWNSRYRSREAKKARDEELEGLLILLSIEVARNNRVLGRFIKQREQPDAPQFPDNRVRVAADLQSAVWDESKVRLAQLRIPGTYLSTVALYYEHIEILRREWKVSGGRRFDSDIKNARETREDGISIIKDTQRYISDPEFAARMLKDEDL